MRQALRVAEEVRAKAARRQIAHIYFGERNKLAGGAKNSLSLRGDRISAKRGMRSIAEQRVKKFCSQKREGQLPGLRPN